MPLFLGAAMTELRASKKKGRKALIPSMMAGRQILPLSGAPEPAALRAPFRVAGWKLLLPLLTFSLELQSFLNRSLGLP